MSDFKAKRHQIVGLYRMFTLLSVIEYIIDNYTVKFKFIIE